MGLKERIQKEIEKLQRQLEDLNKAPEDIYPIGTVIIFATAQQRWFIEKVAEETWQKIKQGIDRKQQSLAEWILEAEESNVGYFEVYVTQTMPEPIYAKAD